VPRLYREHPEFNWDLPTNGKIEYVGIMNTPEDVASLMKKCDFLLYPSFCEAAPNVIAEAMACGVKPLHICKEGGTLEMMERHKDKPYTIQEMGKEYLDIFNKVMK